MLSDACDGDRVTFSSSCCSRVAMRMQSMGVFPGVEMQVLRNSGVGPVLVVAESVRICLERAVARRIVVENVRGGRHDFG